jgi:hypothetical protein
MKLSKKKRIRQKQIKRKMEMAKALIRFFSAAMDWHQKRSAAISAAHKFPSGGIMFKEALPNFGKIGDKVVLPTQITIDPDCKTEFTVTQQGFKEFHQQTES